MLTQQQVGRFEIRDWIGRGAMGDVHLAWDPERNTEDVGRKVKRRRLPSRVMSASARPTPRYSPPASSPPVDS